MKLEKNREGPMFLKEINIFKEMEKGKIKIAGAGLAGLTAAINLAKAGFEVEVHEKCSKIGDHYKENPQMLPNWFYKEDVIEELERCNVKIKWLNRINEVRVYLPRQEIVFYGEKTPVGYTVLRGGENSFEKDLARQAVEAGAMIITDSPVNVRKENFDIIATGLGKPITVGYGRVYKGEFNPEKAKVFFDPSLTPTVGYCYLFPHSQNVVTVKISRLIGEEGVNIRENFEKFKEKFLKDEIKEKNFLYEFGSLRSFDIPKSAIINNSLIIGEAAGFQDELFRFGMRYAILSGYFAAKSIIEGLNYDNLWQGRFMKEFQRTGKTKKIFVDLKKQGFNVLSGEPELFVDIEKFKKLWLSRKADFLLTSYPIYKSLLLNRGFMKIVLKAFLKLN